MKKSLKIFVVGILIISVAGIWGYKKYQINNNPKNIAQTEFKNMPALLEFSSETCYPCKQMKPVIEEIKKDYEGKAMVKIVDVYEDMELAEKYNIRLIPTQIFLDKEGKEYFRHEGLFPKEEIIKIFNEMGVK